ncbi:P-loop containing nucleoside triphosphate hydrolase [Brevundimonas phage vB_BpoS-Papperlapapp]|uniref:P-loop containing nucleoside triphosphate hydrolase n=2 Tax=Marchewkavirus TaxID=3425052 RepID=A0A9E7SJS8_9CAUD|nr:P-loop containing nucleoside triphosphate hydrolase [Brevundimonas phage vB_BpoS-Kabachok]USN14850.1 P-loop containing nucleoside triphosphate hydrolase [Brevundimonas phage vB_BpoS-Domovoi]USN16222.1 P-loop containing nucleoside triphosphate hydrolase [Brevundimonas phage vB_BpoS-Papperlapapp]
MSEAQTRIVYGEPGVGKTTNAERLRLKFDCTSIVDDWNGRDPLAAGALALTTCPGPYRDAPDVEVLTYEQAMA